MVATNHLRLGFVAMALLGWAVEPAWGRALFAGRYPSYLQQRGAEVGTALLVEYFNQPPQYDEDQARPGWERRMQAGLEKFKRKVSKRYTEGTLQRCLDSHSPRTRRAAVLAIGLSGTYQSNAIVAARLHDDDIGVRSIAADTLWALWYRADSEAHNKELQRLMRLRLEDAEESLIGLDALIRKTPRFAEAYNQRAILHFGMKQFQKSIADCERVLELNPHHFGAMGGMGQCYMELRKPKSALKAYRQALKINPDMEGVGDSIRALEEVLGEEGRKDDKK